MSTLVDTGAMCSIMSLQVAQYFTREVQNIEQLEVMLPTDKKVIMNEGITLDVVIENIVFTQQYFVL